MLLPSSFYALWVIPLYSAKVRKGSSWLPDMRVLRVVGVTLKGRRWSCEGRRWAPDMRV